MPAVLDIEQAIALLELEAPFEKRDVQIARRRMAKRWHPDIAPPGKQFEHERHLKAINQAADQLEERDRLLDVQHCWNEHLRVASNARHSR